MKATIYTIISSRHREWTKRDQITRTRLLLIGYDDVGAGEQIASAVPPYNTIGTVSMEVVDLPAAFILSVTQDVSV
jgi:hypothetical protein